MVRHVLTNFIQFLDSLSELCHPQIAFWCGKWSIRLHSQKPSWHLFLYQNLFIFISSKTELGVQCHRIATLTQTKRPNKTSRICPWGVCMSSQAVVKMSSLCFIFKCHSLFHDLNALPTALKEKGNGQKPAWVSAGNKHQWLIPSQYSLIFIHDEKTSSIEEFLELRSE